MFSAAGPLWRKSAQCFPGLAPGALRQRIRFVRNGLRVGPDVQPFLTPETGSTLETVLQARPEMAGALVWPYICAGWGPETRLRRIAGHYAVIDELPQVWRFGVDERIVLADLSDHYPDLRLVIDQPLWFLREGGLVVNLFVGSFRAFSLAFSLYPEADRGRQAVVGAIQGRNREDALDVYRDLTKALHGLRPRDLLFEVFRMLCRLLDVEDILAVSQKHRHHRHPFFGNMNPAPDYDAIWEDRGGSRIDDMFYRFDVAPPVRDLDTVKPKKRSLYRKRYGFLAALEDRIRQDLPAARPVTFRDT